MLHVKRLNGASIPRTGAGSSGRSDHSSGDSDAADGLGDHELAGCGRLDEPGEEVDEGPEVVAFAWRRRVRSPPRPGPAAGRRRLPPPRRPRGRSDMPHPPTAPQKKTSSPIILITRPPARTALDQAADSKRVRARLCSRRPRDCDQAVEPTRSTKPSATISVGPSDPRCRRPRGCWTRPGPLGPALRPFERVHDHAGPRRRERRGMPASAASDDAGPGQFVGTLSHADPGRTRPRRARPPTRRR